MEVRCFRPGLHLRAEPASPTNSINEIEDGVFSEVPPTIELPQRRRQRPRRLFPEACHLLPPELQLHRNATRGTTLLGETSGATDAGWATNQRLLGKVARPSLFEGRSTGTIAVRAAGVLSQGGPGGRDKVAAVGARAARENEADEQADSG